MRLEEVLDIGGKHFKRPNMSDWMVVKGEYIVFEHDLRARPILTVTDWKAEDWACEISKEEALATQFESTYSAILHDPESKLSDAMVERFLAMETLIKQMHKEAMSKSGTNAYVDRFEGIKMQEIVDEANKHRPPPRKR